MTFKPAPVDWPMQRGTYGARGALVFQCLDDDGVTPLPLAGATVTFSTVNLQPPIMKSTADGSLTLTSDSEASWEPTKAEVASIKPGRWTRYYVEIEWPDGSGYRFMEGYLIGRGL